MTFQVRALASAAGMGFVASCLALAALLAAQGGNLFFLDKSSPQHICSEVALYWQMSTLYDLENPKLIE